MCRNRRSNTAYVTPTVLASRADGTYPVEITNPYASPMYQPRGRRGCCHGRRRRHRGPLIIVGIQKLIEAYQSSKARKEMEKNDAARLRDGHEEEYVGDQGFRVGDVERVVDERGPPPMYVSGAGPGVESELEALAVAGEESASAVWHHDEKTAHLKV